MQSDDEVKENFRKQCVFAPEKHYPVNTLKQLGFSRSQCENCKRFFWSMNRDQSVCGDSVCSGGFRFIGNSPAKKQLDYVEAWQKFASIHEKMGYTPVKRYPVVARWNPTVDFTIASIAAFQPNVVSGEVDPPANPLVIPQFCLRFGDIDNVGVTGSHYVGFVMMGEHAFVSPKEYDINKYIGDHLSWLNKGMGLMNGDITVHEDVWAGGGNFGPCMEFFSCGLEVSNQVYMQYEVTSSGSKELKIKVLDMGQGQERVPWFTQGKSSSYETTFPDVVKKLYSRTGLKCDEKLMRSFLPFANFVNVGEVKNIQKAWDGVGRNLGMSGEDLRSAIEPVAGLYSVAEHVRALLFAVSDGGLPSNVGGMYNLRVILRRALMFIGKYGWDVDLCELCEWHAKYLKSLYPELLDNVKNVQKVLDVEKVKFRVSQEKALAVVKQFEGKAISTDKLVEIYDSQGINPELIAKVAPVKVPQNFYALVAARHSEKESFVEKEIVVDFGNVNETRALYFDDWSLTGFKAIVVGVKNNFVVLDQTAFYPTSGGQIHDIGVLGGVSVVRVFKQGGLIVHEVSEGSKFKVGQRVEGVVDKVRRKQLAQHHTSTHIVNAAARRVLGPHVNQAGARKELDKATIDITHYASLSEEELEMIEQEANKIVASKIPIKLSFVPRTKAEVVYGTNIYQGGVAPGKQLRIVNIVDTDVEACGGTHLTNTKDAVKIKIVKSAKIKDGIVRITFVAGEAANSFEDHEKSIVDRLSKLLNVSDNQVPDRALELFVKWKHARKVVQKKQFVDLNEFDLISKGRFDGNVVEKAAEFLQTQPEHVIKTVERFLRDLDELKQKIRNHFK